jgi:SAM-dependent methyltransferase
LKFNIKNYYLMYQKRGMRLCFSYFFELQLFDLINGTDTHVWLPKKNYTDTLHLKNFENCTLYMGSWTSLIKEATNKALDLFSLNPSDVAFVDIGCGKGKVLCVWNKMFLDAKRIVGIEFSEHLIKISKSNLQKISASEVEIICGDATKVSLNFDCSVNLLYLYNPFDVKILSQFVENIGKQDTIIIYFNPVHKSIFFDNGFIECVEKKSWYPGSNYIIFSNIRSK